MILTYKLHLDDYHAKREADVESEAAAVEHVMEWITNGYDVGEILLDGKALR